MVTKAYMIIDGNDTKAISGRTFDRISGITESVVSTASAASIEDAREAIKSAAKAFTLWSRTSPLVRRDCLARAAARLEAASKEIATVMMMETGAAKSWADFNVKLACDVLREAAALTTHVTGDVIPTNTPDSLSLATREPWGVCLGIAPWNAPIILFVRSFALAVACGNTVVMKASELCPATHYLIVKAITNDALPPGVVNMVSHAAEDAPEIVQAMIADPLVKHVNFTGSSHVGRIIATHAAQYLKPVLLELGGKSPTIVLDDADLDDAVDAAAFGSFMHQGQVCMATGRVIVLESVADEFVEKFTRKAKALERTNYGENAPLGALISKAAAARIETLIRDAVEKGAIRRSGSNPQGTFMDPTVLDRVTPEMEIYYAEAFGPVAPVIRVKDVDQAVEIANDTEYGLSAAIFSRNIAAAMAVSRRIESGICHINGPTIQDEAQIPFGGVKASGYGRFGGRGSVEAFTYLRWLTIETRKHHYPF